MDGIKTSLSLDIDMWQLVSDPRDSLLEGEARTVTHMQFHGWPKNGFPEQSALVSFMETFKKLKSPSDGPLVVLCCDGVTRSGMFVALDILTDERETGKTTTVDDCVRHLWHTNSRIIETSEQYKFLYQFCDIWENHRWSSFY